MTDYVTTHKQQIITAEVYLSPGSSCGLRVTQAPVIVTTANIFAVNGHAQASSLYLHAQLELDQD